MIQVLGKLPKISQESSKTEKPVFRKAQEQKIAPVRTAVTTVKEVVQSKGAQAPVVNVVDMKKKPKMRKNVMLVHLWMKFLGGKTLTLEEAHLLTKKKFDVANKKCPGWASQLIMRLRASTNKST